VSAGHCAKGLDTCWLRPRYFSGPDTELDRLANLYHAQASERGPLTYRV